MNNCSEKQTKICKVYIADCYKHLATSFNACNGIEQEILKKNIFDMLDKIKSLLNNETLKKENPKKENNSVKKTD